MAIPKVKEQNIIEAFNYIDEYGYRLRIRAQSMSWYWRMAGSTRRNM